MSVHYKFKSGKDKHTVIFDGLHISVADLKKEIMKQRKIGKSADLDLQITNPQTGEVYESDSTLIPKNTSVDVARVPVSGNQKKSWDRHDNNSSKGSNSPSHIELDKITKVSLNSIVGMNDTIIFNDPLTKQNTAINESSNLSTSYGTEDEKIKAMMSQSTQEYDPSKYVKNRGMVGPLPSNYTCYRCGQPGHYIKQCPTNNSDVKRSTGIPRSFMIPAKADQKGALLTASGDYAVPIIDHEAYKEVRKEKPPFLPNSESEKEAVLPEIPEDLKCTLCQGLLQDAVLIPCCGNSYCDECIRTLLLESEYHECPTCHEVNVSPDTLIPNRYLRISVTKFTNDTGYERDKYVSNETKIDETKQLQTEDKVEKVETNETNFDETEIKSDLSPQRSQSPILNNSDVTMDEVILGSPKKEELTKVIVEPVAQPVAQPSIVSNDSNAQKLDENNDSNEDGNDSQQETATGSNTPLVDEPSDSYETSEEQSNQTEVNTIVTLPHYTNQPLLSMPVYPPRPTRMMGPIRAIRTTVGQQQQNHALLGRPPILPHPRNVYPRPGLTQDARFYRPMTDPRGFPMGLAHVPPYYTQQMRPPAYHDPYGYMGPRSHLTTGPMHHTLLHQGMAEAPPPGTAPIVTDNIYPYSKPEYDDYEDRVNRFTRQLESRPTRRPKARSMSRSRSRSHSRSSRSRSSSESSSSSSSSSSRSSRFSFSSRSFSGSSRSRSYSPRRRSRSRSRYRRRSRSPSPRHNYNRDFRYRRSRSPHYNDSARRYGRSRRGYDNERERDKYRDNRTNRYERNDTSYRSRRSDDKSKDSKQTHSSRCNHKSSHEKVRTREKRTDNEDAIHKTSGKTLLKEEHENEPEVKESNTKSETIELNIAMNETQVENDSNKVMAVDNESHKETNNKSIELTENEKLEENDDKDRNDRKKDKEKPKKHHKHHHHHHHRHRKESDDSKVGKASDETKVSSKKKHKHKKHKQSENSNKTKTIDVIKEEIKDNPEVDSNRNSESIVNSEKAELVISHPLIVNKYESDLDEINLQNKTEDINDVNNVNEQKIESAINNYELYDGIDSVSDNKSSDLAEFTSSDLPNYSTVEFSTNSHKSSNEEVINTVSKDPKTEVNRVHLVDYTDNEDLTETPNDCQTNTNLNEFNKVDSENNKSDDLEAKVSVEVPKSKWDEDFNDLRFEEDYSDFEDSQKSEFETHDKKSRDSHNEKPLPNDIIQKAEKAILEKPLRVAIVEKRDKTSTLDKKPKTAKTDERDKKVIEVNDYERNKRDKESDRDKKDRQRDRTIISDHSSKSSSKNGDKSQLIEIKDGKNVVSDELSESNESHPRKVKLDRSKFAEKPTLSITIDNSEKEKNDSRNSRSSNRYEDSNSKSYSSSYHKSSRDRSKDRSRSDRKSSKDRKESSKSRDESRHRSHKRSKRSRSRSSSSHKRYKSQRETQKKSKSKSITSSKKSK